MVTEDRERDLSKSPGFRVLGYISELLDAQWMAMFPCCEVLGTLYSHTGQNRVPWQAA